MAILLSNIPERLSQVPCSLLKLLEMLRVMFKLVRKLHHYSLTKVETSMKVSNLVEILSSLDDVDEVLEIKPSELCNEKSVNQMKDQGLKAKTFEPVMKASTSTGKQVEDVAKNMEATRNMAYY
nr:hypothetical protein [Tanacetum cinerariifolium]